MKQDKSSNLLKERWYILLFLYIPIYLYAFFYIEGIQYEKTTVIHMALDDMIPYCRYFIIPYMSWFLYMLLAVVFFFFYNKNDFISYALFLIIGMTTCLIIYVIFPSSLNLRPESVDTSDIFGYLVNFIYKTDTSTNVCPSIHCLNAFGTHIAIRKCGYFRQRPAYIYSSFILVILICLSTLFLKQHSVYDILAAVLLTVILYPLIYRLIPRLVQKHGKDTVTQ